MNTSIKTAVIVAAGFGLRLRPLTEDIPKTLLKVTDYSILENTLTILSHAGFTDVSITVGYRRELIENFFTAHYRGMNIKYIYNEIYSTTNSMYSLMLAGAYLSKGCLLVEGDIYFTADILKNISDDCWVCSPLEEDDGYVINGGNRVSEIRRIQKGESPENFFKSAGIISFGSKNGEKFAHCLKTAAENGNENLHYERILQENLNSICLKPLQVPHAWWHEIDDADDLNAARQKFGYGV